MGHNSGTTTQTHRTAEGPEGYQSSLRELLVGSSSSVPIELP